MQLTTRAPIPIRHTDITLSCPRNDSTQGTRGYHGIIFDMLITTFKLHTSAS